MCSSRPALELGRELHIGINTYLQHINDQGGVAGRKLKLIALDDEYDPDRALANMRTLYEEHKVFAVVGNIGTPTADKTLPYALDKKMLFFGALTGSKLLRQSPPDRYVFNCRASLEEETAFIVKYLVEDRNIQPKQIAVFAQQDSYGDDAFNGVVRALRHHGRERKDILRVGYERNTVKVENAAKTILQHPEISAIVMAPTYKPAAKFIRQVKDAKPEMIFTSVTFVGSEALAQEFKTHGPREYMKGIIVTQVVPPVDSGATLVLKYRELLKKYYPSERPGFTSLEGYLDAVLLTEGLKRAGTHLTTERLIDALESIRDFDVGLGAPISFGPSEHQASHKVWGTVLDKDGTYRNLVLEE
jgi:ABC-type branched-subunit amino acid transport system substrate-binding protein